MEGVERMKMAEVEEWDQWDGAEGETGQERVLDGWDSAGLKGGGT